MPGQTKSFDSRAREASSKNRTLRIQVFCNDPFSNLTKIRLRQPLTRLATETNKVVRFSSYLSASDEDIIWPDVIIIQRAYSRSVLPLVARARNLGKPVIYEIDDLLTEIPEFLSHHTGYIRNKKSIIRLINMCDAVSVTQPKLREALLPWNSSIFICPNYATPGTTPTDPDLAHTDDETANLILASSDRIRLDFLMPALEQIQAIYGDRVKLTAIGNVAHNMDNIRLKFEKIEILPINEFNQLVASKKNAIGLIPLDDSKFSSCKSAVKYFDYTQAGALAVCSDCSPYRDVVSHLHNGLLTKNTTEAWVENISQAIESTQLRRQLVEAAQHLIAQDHNIDVAVKHWRSLFDWIAPDHQVSVLSRKNLSPGTILSIAYGKLSDLNRKRRTKRRVAKSAAD